MGRRVRVPPCTVLVINNVRVPAPIEVVRSTRAGRPRAPGAAPQTAGCECDGWVTADSDLNDREASIRA
jgi:hypothetical protein